MDKSANERPSVPESVLEATLEVWGRMGKQHVIAVSGSSMRPLIRDGDEVLISHGCADVRRGDVVVFRQEGTLVAHRVLRISAGDAEPSFITKGDNSTGLDAPVSGSQIVGRVLAVRTADGHTSLDTAAWRRLGWVVAYGALISAKVYSSGRDLKQPLLGPGFRKLTTLFYKGTRSVSWVLLRVAHTILGGRKT